MQPPVKSESGKCNFDKLLNAVSLPGRDNVIVGLWIPDDANHCVDVVRSVAPVNSRGQIAEYELLIGIVRDCDCSARNLLRDEISSSQRRLVIVKEADRSANAMTLPIEATQVDASCLRDSVNAARPKRS